MGGGFGASGGEVLLQIVFVDIRVHLLSDAVPEPIKQGRSKEIGVISLRGGDLERTSILDNSLTQIAPPLRHNSTLINLERTKLLLMSVPKRLIPRSAG